MPYRDFAPREPVETMSLEGSSLAREDVDPEIWEFIVELNGLGYPTILSCAGHKRGSPYGRDLRSGFVDFSVGLLPEEITEIKSIARRFGLRNLKVVVGEEGTRLTFSPVGKWY